MAGLVRHLAGDGRVEDDLFCAECVDIYASCVYNYALCVTLAHLTRSFLQPVPGYSLRPCWNRNAGGL